MMKLGWFLSSVVVFGSALAGNLPQLNDQPWIGWYAGYECRDFRFGVKNDGEASLIPLQKKEPISPRYWIDIIPVIEEVLPGGRVVTKKAQDGGWEALTESTAEAEKISYRGTVTGGAKFEVHFELDGDEILGGGKILDKGELTENPIRLSIRVRVPNVYYHTKNEEDVEDKADGDRIQVERSDGKKLRFDGWDPVWAEKEDVSGPGIKTARIDLDGYKGAKIDLESGDKGLFEFWNGEKRPLYKGFTFGWKPDPLKDPEGKARFTLKFG
ncbi:hypothetical protein HAHE_10120 [Haloferula helveola]|uniref:Uncharacterized protein n=1 Tax=Haloferula helveola TaxID=490095 RepID=A0ABN6H0M0_9BACT|nr:hypothetical protein HAHE_10120 [Haloferula helveola]